MTKRADRVAYQSVSTSEECSRLSLSSHAPAPAESPPSPHSAKSEFPPTERGERIILAPPQRSVRKWRAFPGKNKFCCDGRLMLSRQSGIFYFTCTLIVITSSLFLFFDCRYLTVEVSPLVPVVAVLLFVFVMGALLRTALSDPGIIPRASAEEGEATERHIDGTASTVDGVYRPPPRTREVFINGQLVRLKYCFTCKIFRPPRASHCSVCDNCVERFDHHCPWVGNCIGQRNYRYFYLFLVSLSLLCVLILCFSVTTLVLKSLKDDFLTALKESPTSLIEAIIAFLSIWSVFGLAGFHTYLTVCNITTNEDIKRSTDKSSGPKAMYSRGSMLDNYCEVVCGPIPPSLIDRRGIIYIDAATAPLTPQGSAGGLSRCSTDRSLSPLSLRTWTENSATQARNTAARAWNTPDEPPAGGVGAEWGGRGGPGVPNESQMKPHASGHRTFPQDAVGLVPTDQSQQRSMTSSTEPAIPATSGISVT